MTDEDERPCDNDAHLHEPCACGHLRCWDCSPLGDHYCDEVAQLTVDDWTSPIVNKAAAQAAMDAYQKRGNHRLVLKYIKPQPAPLGD